MRYLSREMILDDVVRLYEEIASWCTGWSTASAEDVWAHHSTPYKGEAFPHAMRWEAFQAEYAALQRIATAPAPEGGDALDQAYALLGCRLDHLPDDEMRCCECGQKDVEALIEFGVAEDRGATCLDSETVPPRRVCMTCLLSAMHLLEKAGVSVA